METNKISRPYPIKIQGKFKLGQTFYHLQRFAFEIAYTVHLCGMCVNLYCMKVADVPDPNIFLRKIILQVIFLPSS